MANPDLLHHVPFCGDILANIGKTFPELVLLTNLFALVSHLAEGIVAMIICDKLRVRYVASRPETENMFPVTLVRANGSSKRL